MNDSDIEKLQRDLDRLGEWAVENAVKINQGKSKAVSFTRARVTDSLNYSFGDQRISEASSCKYLGVIIPSDLSWAVQVNYTVQKAWKAGLWSRYTKLPTPTPQFSKRRLQLRLLHKSSISINNGKPTGHFITTT
jgi:hypothetical protein